MTTTEVPIEQKRCPRCEETKPRSLEFFSADCTHRDNIGSWCRTCCDEVYGRERRRGAA